MDLFSSTKTPGDAKFHLKRDLVFFDIESTGLNVLKDRIVQIAFIKYFKDNRSPEELEMLINPGIPISPEAMGVHGITPDDVRDKPLFKDVAREIFEFIGDADLAGYNSDRFDLPMLSEEFDRCGFDLEIENRKSIDVQKIFYKMEPRTLKAAYKFYCDSELEDAHDALVDVRATANVLLGQIEKYKEVDYIDDDGLVINKPIRNDIDSIHQFISDFKVVDFTQRLRRNSKGNIVFNFGKYLNQEVKEVFKTDKNYYHWILQKDFSSQVKKIVRGLMKEVEKDSVNS